MIAALPDLRACKDSPDRKVLLASPEPRASAVFQALKESKETLALLEILARQARLAFRAWLVQRALAVKPETRETKV